MKTLSVKAQRALGNWFVGDDTGISSTTMAAIALGATNSSGLSSFDAPYDPADFGRCYRLVTAVPEIREFFPRIGKKVPAFRGILREWDDLVKLFKRDQKSGRSDELYQRIKQLRGDR
ncbi:hypothetical protein [Burkholderia sp. Bp8990]|uniref:hypothetical protein n=1 Tax=Burkholderia sp. Bp8990 TaxID=2184552 RepID=UPI000F599071|nr:hypothetical protein [Burkholderia sp. Bp8990]RQS39746.1 hypothetical protein DIE01_16155 [Burkholderia sp. Bp8990]